MKKLLTLLLISSLGTAHALGIEDLKGDWKTRIVGVRRSGARMHFITPTFPYDDGGDIFTGREGITSGGDDLLALELSPPFRGSTVFVIRQGFILCFVYKVDKQAPKRLSGTVELCGEEPFEPPVYFKARKVR